MTKNNFTIIAIFCFIASCSAPKYATNKEYLVYGFDFSMYSDKGFTFTPLSIVDRAYESRGMINIVAWPDVMEITEVTRDNTGKPIESKFYKPQKIYSDEVIKYAYDYAVSIGANAIIQFQLKSITGTRGNIPDINGLELTGFAIRFK